jgi:hypothetical protein
VERSAAGRNRDREGVREAALPHLVRHEDYRHPSVPGTAAPSHAVRRMRNAAEQESREIWIRHGWMAKRPGSGIRAGKSLPPPRYSMQMTVPFWVAK